MKRGLINLGKNDLFQKEIFLFQIQANLLRIDSLVKIVYFQGLVKKQNWSQLYIFKGWLKIRTGANMHKNQKENPGFNESQKSIKFLIATDIHLGHKQNHSVRKNDSFNAFEQVLSIAQNQSVDFLLLGGDLFDEVNPSQKTIYKCLDILQSYVQGQGKQDLNAKWVQNEQFKINFQNKNMSIKLPIFTIHGNHDYPSNDFGKLSICDLLHVSNYANYFGKHTSLSEIVIKPIIIEKKDVSIKIAIYGLGYIKDTVLNQLFQQKKVKFLQLENREQYFCLFILHQNRYKKSMKPGAPALKCISSKHIPTWMDLTIWGHEHEAISKIQVQDERQIFQPGSTIITSFIEAEAFPKQSLLISISDKKIDLEPIPLKKSYRPMVCRNYQISELSVGKQSFDFYSFLDEQLKVIVADVEKEFPDKKPIIRVKIQYTGYEISRCKTLELKYAQKVANPESIISFWKRKQEKLQNDKQVFQAFISKADMNYDQKEITDEILIKYTNAQQNKPLYYDPSQLFKHHQTSIEKQFMNSKEYLAGFFKRQIDRRSKPMAKQLQNISKSSLRQMDNLAKLKIQKIVKLLDLNNDDSQDDQNLHNNNDLNQITWEQHRKILLLKEEQLNKINLLQNYGDNFTLNSQKKQKNPYKNNQTGRAQQIGEGQENKNQQTNHKNARESGRSTLSNWIGCQSSNKMQQQGQSKKTKVRNGILKKNNLQLSDYQDQCQQEQDCCKRAQKTPYNEYNTKNSFEGANKMVKENVEKKNKKGVRVKDQNVKNKKKSVRWSDSQSK